MFLEVACTIDASAAEPFLQGIVKPLFADASGCKARWRDVDRVRSAMTTTAAQVLKLRAQLFACSTGGLTGDSERDDQVAVAVIAWSG